MSASFSDDEELDDEGVPDLEGHPPGIDIETDQEGVIPPRDRPLASGGDPAYAETEAEERVRESVVDRARREQPDVGARELGVGGGVQGEAYLADEVTGPGPEPGSDLEEEDDGADELAEHEPGTDRTDRAPLRLLDSSATDAGELGDAGTLTAGAAEDEDRGQPAEEAAVHLERDDGGPLDEP